MVDNVISGKYMITVNKWRIYIFCSKEKLYSYLIYSSQCNQLTSIQVRFPQRVVSLSFSCHLRNVYNAKVATVILAGYIFYVLLIENLREV